MDIKKCDRCKKQRSNKDENEWVSVLISGCSFGCKKFDFCGECSKRFLGKIESFFGVKEKAKIKKQKNDQRVIKRKK